jgi:GNAT superfamily N-acetyltransferase
MTGVEYRTLTEENIHAVCTLIERTVRTSYRDVYSPRAIEFFLQYNTHEDIAHDARDGSAIVAVMDDSIIGTASLCDDQMKRVFVDPQFQRRGIGKALVALMINKAKVQGVRRIRADASLVSWQMYQRMGFAALGREYRDLGEGDSLPYYKMAFDL